MPYRAPPPEPLTVDEGGMLAADRRRKRIMLAVVAVLVVGGAGGAFALNKMSTRAERAASDLAASRFATCIVGEAKDEKPSTQLRRAILNALGDRSNVGENAWPARCAKLTHALVENAHARGQSGLEDAALRLAKDLESGHGSVLTLGPLVDRTFGELKRSGATVSLVSDVAPAPSAAGVPNVGSLGPDSLLFEHGLPLSHVYFTPFPDTTMRFLADDGAIDGPRVCELPSGAKQVACHRVPAPAKALSPALRLWGTTAPDKAPIVFAGLRGDSGVFRSRGGERISDGVKNGAYGASVLPDDTLAYLAWKDTPGDGEVRLVRVAPDGKTSDALFVKRKDTGNPYYATGLFHGWGFFKQVSGQEIVLMAANVEHAGAPVAPVNVGRIGEVGRIEGGEGEEPHLVGCRTERALAVRAKGWAHAYFSFYTGSQWSPPVQSRLMTGELFCDGLEAITVQQAGEMQNNRYWPLFGIDRCSPSGCSFSETRFRRDLTDDPALAPLDARSIAATDIGGKLALVWRAGEDGGLRLRVAPPAQLGTTRDKVIFDDHIFEDGAFRSETTLVEFALRSLGKTALLLLNTTRGTHAFLVDGDGKLTPVSSKVD